MFLLLAWLKGFILLCFVFRVIWSISKYVLVQHAVQGCCLSSDQVTFCPAVIYEY
jgi:hypothetical protein